MEQKFEGSPRAEIRLEGRKVIRTEVTPDWGSRLQWEVRRDGKVIATPPARAEISYEHPDATPGTYEIVLQLWKYVNYRKKPDGEFIDTKKQARKVKSATFFTAQVDFSEAGDLKLFTGPETMGLLEELTKEKGYLDGRYMAATFNLLRGRDLIWNYVVNNYLLGEEPPPFDLLHWNSDTTNLPAGWHRDYLETLYKGNKLAEKGAISVAGTSIDIGRVKTPTYIQAGRDDHIAPPQSVWKIMDHFAGPKRFVLAGSGHIAGVVNPPSAQKYQYWVNDEPCGTLESFIDGATEHKGSWWPDWLEWLKKQDRATVKAAGARIPGEGKLKAIEDAPGSYVKAR